MRVSEKAGQPPKTSVAPAASYLTYSPLHLYISSDIVGAILSTMLRYQSLQQFTKMCASNTLGNVV